MSITFFTVTCEFACNMAASSSLQRGSACKLCTTKVLILRGCRGDNRKTSSCPASTRTVSRPAHTAPCHGERAAARGCFSRVEARACTSNRSRERANPASHSLTRYCPPTASAGCKISNYYNEIQL